MSKKRMEIMHKELEQKREQRETAYKKIKNGNGVVTYADCLLALEYNWDIISLIPLEYLTEEVCLNALKGNHYFRNIIKYFPKTLLTNEFVNKIIDVKGRYLKYLSEDFINDDLILRAVKQDLCAVKYLPKKFETDDIYIALFNIDSQVLKYIDSPSEAFCEYVISKDPASFSYLKNKSTLTYNLCKRAVELKWKNLKYVPQEHISQELCEVAFNKKWNAFKFFPDKYKTPKICAAVLEKDVSYIKYCPLTIITVEMYEKCLREQGRLLRYVPEELRSKALCLLAIEEDYTALDYTPEKLLSDEFYVKCLKVNCATIAYVPDKFKTYETYKMILNHISLTDNFREWLISDEKEYYTYSKDNSMYKKLKEFSETLERPIYDYDVLRKERALYLRRTICSEFDCETNAFIVIELIFKTMEEQVFTNFEDYYLYLDGNLEGANLTEYNFEGIDISRYNLEGAFLGSSLLAQTGNYNGDFYDLTVGKYKNELSLINVSNNETSEKSLNIHYDSFDGKLSDCNRNIFYITDIHLNHRLIDKFPDQASFDEIRFFIQKQVRKMINTSFEKGENDYLLIGGDVSFCFDISKIFYKELCKLWNPSNVVVVLGNHELWDFNRFGGKTSELPLEEIIKKYEVLFGELGITFLQNDLLIINGGSSSILTEKDILNTSVEKLREIAFESNLMLFGGIGFSAYNTDFNASHGIYRNAIVSLESDLFYTRKTELVYDKLSEAYYDDHLIVLSHMPPQDWSKRDIIPNWRYVYGHTHTNYYSKTDKGAIYADNQMGYKSKSIGLKYFKNGLYYDIFKYYLDGIHSITKSQYFDFLKGNNIYCDFNRQIENITMLKRQELYLFLVEDKENNKLYLLNGGVLNRLRVVDVKYYYENMIKYSDFVKKDLKKYNEALKRIAEVVKKIGGVGFVHGCIVDIDFYNHIYLNPQDGCITAYYSGWFGDRYEYSAVENLLEEKLPKLYANYKKLLGTTKSLVTISSSDDSSNDAVHITDTSQYKPSRIIKCLQYITDNNIIRMWIDEFVDIQDRQIEGGEKLLLE